jgi:hypothetical protein
LRRWRLAVETSRDQACYGFGELGTADQLKVAAVKAMLTVTQLGWWQRWIRERLRSHPAHTISPDVTCCGGVRQLCGDTTSAIRPNLDAGSLTPGNRHCTLDSTSEPPRSVVRASKLKSWTPQSRFIREDHSGKVKDELGKRPRHPGRALHAGGQGQGPDWGRGGQGLPGHGPGQPGGPGAGVLPTERPEGYPRAPRPAGRGF